MDDQKILSLFQETNEHLRNTDQKHITVSLAHFSTLAIVFSLIAETDVSFFTPSITNIIIHSLLLIIGVIIYTSQLWFRIWKEHYIDVLLGIVQSWNIDNQYCPYWLRKKIDKNRFSFDKIFIYFTFVLNVTMLIILTVDICLYSKSVFYKIFYSLIVNSLFVFLMFFLKRKMDKNKDLIA